ncbi:proton-conducting transporter transmembrane domain-containing protein [Terrimonas pollutisoli]|uniref:proton-conducting transporter transmembrane domain-containing protein n=1 Tax=Terrimonas pollutisoli TaxID=3034147 RepID=UPI0023EB686E|nr:proton-conducting transporter membrane subunit [Terrimonas sp. H1YJ31]
MLLQLISLFVFIPLVAFLASLFWQNKQEKPIALIVQFTKAFYMVAAVVYCALWIINGGTPFSQYFATLYKTDHFVFAIQFYYDHITAVYSIVGAILFFLVSTFSRYYMHRDEGYKRFFNTILFFALGYNLIIFSGNFETLFIGWEIIGLSSFLLIAFYRNRYLPVKNAFKTISNYRISDLALILAMWMMHHLTHQNIIFTRLNEAREIALQQDHGGMALFIAIMIALAAIIKSAQFPFTSWLPRAMEGPTSSSAIFYGSLSVHIGVFILLRTWPFWQDMTAIKIIIIAVGAVTGIIATLIARVQPTVKTQIAYSSAAQIGIIFIEVALGFHILALIHFAGNAFLRTYQLLVSPSVLNYLVHHQYFHYHPQKQQPVQGARAGLYMLGIKEWNLDTMLYKYLWNPFKWIGKQFQFLNSKIFLVAVGLIALTAMIGPIYNPKFFVSQRTGIAVTFLSISLAIILFAFSHRGSALVTWQYLLLAHIFIIAGVVINTDHVNTIEIIFYASGVVIAFVLGYYCLQKIKAIDGDITLNNYHGYVYEEKTIAFLFLLAAIGMLGFPITAAFIGIDVLFTYVEHTQGFLITLLALCLIFIELAAIRIFLRIFLGQHKKLNHPVAFRSS